MRADRDAAYGSPSEMVVEMAGWVLGCHRSGTSLLSSILRGLTNAGPDQALGQDQPGDIANPDGYYETFALVEANEQLLKWAGCTWDRPFVARPAWEDPASLLLIARLRDLMSRHTGEADWIDKDPRLCLTRDALTHLLLRDIPALAIVRNPLEVATSLNMRDGFPLRKGAAIWVLYNMHLFNSHSRPPKSTILFDDLMSQVEETRMNVATDIANFLRAACQGNCSDDRSPSLEQQAKMQLDSRQRKDLLRSETRWHAEKDRLLVGILEEIWDSCRVVIQAGDDRRIASYMREAWAAIAPVVESEVAIPLREQQSATNETTNSRWFSKLFR